MAKGREIVSSSFIIPYPPGFPILVPGQVISEGILAFMRALDVNEIHGYRPDLGLRVFTDEALAQHAARARFRKRPNKTRRGQIMADTRPRPGCTATSRRNAPRQAKAPGARAPAQEADEHLGDPPLLSPQRDIRSISSRRPTSTCLGLDEWVKNFKYIMLSRLL